MVIILWDLQLVFAYAVESEVFIVDGIESAA